MNGPHDESDDDTGDSTSTGYASPPCFMHEVDPAYMGLTETTDPRQRTDVQRWRKAERARLLAIREAIPGDARKRMTSRITAHLDTLIGPAAGLVVSAYWPIRGEPDLRPFLALVTARGGTAALPVVVERGRPLIFRAWAAGDPLDSGVWNIPIPRADAAEVVPDVVIAPVVGFDEACYRLGYGGGFFDRTLAAAPNRPRAIGVGYASAAIRTIYPQPHDIAMSAVVTEDGVVRFPTIIEMQDR